ncbi:hypothetical protein [Pseudoduganella umbonata]|uniref:Uncharacterized protein n=1 Tax=Pseudoduganella umbonata TaxID=864828 RepID=A0A4P8HQZ0_9BURK|nr:hypothetical protein [Pseudoduganella umbonata]MBB3222451.1 hypothetical protein [Pseudoduganella umbonata]QCP11008.1 hypothetical protein FCL38_11725 [Pseudoduganella umbonata]
MHTSTYSRIVRASGIYDLLVTAPFATPWTFALLHGQLSSVNMALGGAPLPAFTPLHILFACLMGTVVVLWSVLRIGDPQPRFGRYDGAGRFGFSLWMAWTLAQTGMPMLWLFIVPELAWGVVQWLPVRGRQGGTGNGPRG